MPTAGPKLVPSLLGSLLLAWSCAGAEPAAKPTIPCEACRAAERTCGRSGMESMTLKTIGRSEQGCTLEDSFNPTEDYQVGCAPLEVCLSIGCSPATHSGGELVWTAGGTTYTCYDP